jgi:hypothetical protein
MRLMGECERPTGRAKSNDRSSRFRPADEVSIDDYYSKMEPRGAVLMVCDDIASALGEAPNGSA